MIALAALSLLLDTAAPSPSRVEVAYAAPSRSVLDGLSHHCKPGNWLRVTLDSSRIEAQVRVVDARGLHGLTVREPNLPHPDELPWASIARIDAVTTRRGYGLVVGGLVGGLGGLAFGGSGSSNSGNGRPFMYGALLGEFAGSTLGSRIVHERALYVGQARAPGAPANAPVAVVAPPASPAAAAPADSGAAATSGAVVRPPADSPAPQAVNRELVTAALRRMDSGDLLRVEGDFGRFHGYASSLGPEGLGGLRGEPRFPTSYAGSALTWEQIYRIDKRGGSAASGAVHGAVTLGLASGLLTALVLAAANSLADGEGTSGEIFLYGLGGAGVGAGVGALFGGAIGALIPGWHRVYQRP